MAPPRAAPAAAPPPPVLAAPTARHRTIVAVRITLAARTRPRVTPWWHPAPAPRARPPGGTPRRPGEPPARGPASPRVPRGPRPAPPAAAGSPSPGARRRRRPRAARAPRRSAAPPAAAMGNVASVFKRDEDLEALYDLEKCGGPGAGGRRGRRAAWHRLEQGSGAAAQRRRRAARRRRAKGSSASSARRRAARRRGRGGRAGQFRALEDGADRARRPPHHAAPLSAQARARGHGRPGLARAGLEERHVRGDPPGGWRPLGAGPRAAAGSHSRCAAQAGAPRRRPPLCPPRRPPSPPPRCRAASWAAPARASRLSACGGSCRCTRSCRT
jgi:hypothetical protein